MKREEGKEAVDGGDRSLSLSPSLSLSLSLSLSPPLLSVKKLPTLSMATRCGVVAGQRIRDDELSRSR